MLTRHPFVSLLMVLTMSYAAASVKGAIMYTSQTRFVEAVNPSAAQFPLRITAPDFGPFTATARLETPANQPAPRSLAEASMNSVLGEQAMSVSARSLAQLLTPPLGGARSSATFEVSFVLTEQSPFRLYMSAQQLQSSSQSSAGLILFRDGVQVYQWMLDFQTEMTGTLAAGNYMLSVTASAITSNNGSRSGEVIVTGGLEIPSVPTGGGLAGAAALAALRRSRRDEVT